MTMTIGPHQHAWSHSTGRCVHCGIPWAVFASATQGEVEEVESAYAEVDDGDPRALVDLADLKALLMLADEALELHQFAPFRYQNEALLARVAGKAGIEGYDPPEGD